MNAFRAVRWIVLSAILMFTAGLAAGQTVRSASGVDITSITAARDQFRTDLGGGTVAAANGSFGGLRREINWDGVPAAASAPNLLAANFFNSNSPRGVVFSTPGTGFQVSGATTDAGAGQPAPADFGNLDPAYTATFAPFSAQRLFTSLDSNVTDVTFFLPGTNTPALTNGFGAVFSDVDLANTTSIQFFNSANVSLGTFFVPAALGSETFSFLGVSLPSAVVARVRIVSGNTAPATGATDQNGAARDVVVMDDFIYGEPIAAPTAIYTATLSGANENPPVASPGVGTALVTVDSTAHTLRVTATFSGLTSNTTAAHIHCCVAPPAIAGIATMTPSFVGFPLGVTGGTFDQTYDMTLASTWNPAFVTASGSIAGAEAALTAGLAAGQAYFNIHTTTNPGGEVRGFFALQPITVNSTADVAANDGVCTLREAIIAANTNTASGAMAGECAAGQALPTVDIIAFNIPVAGVQTIIPLTSLPTITQAVTINGYTQPGTSPNTNPMSAGINAVLLIEINLENFNTIRIGAAGTTIRGLVVNRGSDKITVEANNATIAGNFLGTNPAGTASSNSGFGGFGIRQNSGNNMTVGGPAPADRNLISGSVQGGIATDLGSSVTSTGHVIEGNYIGPDVTGTLSLSLTTTGAISGLNNAIVRGNLISGNNGGGIIAAQQTANGPVVIQGNLIGTQRDGTSPLGNGSGFGGSGVTLLSSNNTVGGSGAGEANTIAFNAGPGVGVANNTEGNRIAQNSIHSNGALGISLATQTPSIVLANDAGDADTGPGNNGQNYPVLSAASINGGNVLVSGSLNSTAGTTFRLEFFSNTACDATSANGEGQTFLGASTVTTDAGGNVSFNNLSFPALGGAVVTSTATVNPSAGIFTDTSEFSACLNAIVTAPPPSIAKAFGAATVALNGSTTLTFTISNPTVLNGLEVRLKGAVPAGVVGLTGVGFTDTLPAGLVVATPNGLIGTCGGGTITATAGAGSVSLSGASLAPGGSCTFSVNVTGTTAGLKNNSVTVTSTEGGTGNTSNASVTVLAPVAPPTIAKAFGASELPLNGSTTLTFNITNPNAATPLSGIGFTDTLPAGVLVSTPNGLVGTCGGGTITAIAGSNSVSLSAATLAGGASCSFSVNVIGTSAGLKNNSVSVTSTEGGTGNTSNANFTVRSPPTIAKAFGSATIPVNGTTSLTFTITNPPANTVPQTGVAFSDTLPAGLVVATPNGLTGSCGAGTITAVAGSGVVSLSGGSVPTVSTCTFTINVTGTTEGLKNNVTGAVSSTNGGTGNTASASVTAATTLTIGKVFGAASIALNGSTSLTFTITNPNAGIALTGVAFTDTLPSGLVVATPTGLIGSCGGGTITAVAGSGTVSLSGATLAGASACTFSVNVTGTTAGLKTNSVTVSSTQTGVGNTATANVMVVAPPTIAKSFGAGTLQLNGSTTLTFTVTNPNTASALSGIGFTDILPAGMVVSTPNGLTGNCGGGSITAIAGSSSVSLSGATLAANASCSFGVNVTATGAGQLNNVISAATSIEGGSGGSASASVFVGALPTAVIPTLHSWMLALLGLLLSITAFCVFARRGTKRSN